MIIVQTIYIYRFTTLSSYAIYIKIYKNDISVVVKDLTLCIYGKNKTIFPTAKTSTIIKK